jgi:carboxymethylenebutenolidase
MKKLRISIFSVLASLFIGFPFIFSLEKKEVQTQTCSRASMTCCQVASAPAASASESFAMLVDDKSFVNKHEEPLAYTFEGGGEKVSFKTPDGKEGFGWEFKAKKKTKNYIFVIHEWWGLNDYIKKESENIFNTLGNVNVIALDLYDGQVATTREDAGKYMQSVKTERASAIVKGAMEYVGKKAKVGTIGWCFGGGWSLQASLLMGKQAKACVIYYGMPEKDVEKLKTLNPDVLGIFASQEQWISPKVVTEFEENMQKAGKKVTIKNYDADHAFANPSNPKYNKAFADEAMAMSVAFFRERLR